ncbi:hypothetical protein D9613_008632 [Agrocybe pediades]|uniref:Uncharacterized protein n=1 Tax=Agrocybe pediades TaxID=84607 RepID=A0A8H4VQ76_9AGAR|nr:hypothetical protein D9613_008632 [Agrocybe pediades]
MVVQSYATYQPQQQQQPRSYASMQQPPNPATWGPPPFAGAPPIPVGISVNSQQWQQGYWQYNPHYKPSAAPVAQQHVPWIPSHHWMPQTQKYPYPQQQQPQPQQQQQPGYQVYPAKSQQSQPAAQPAAQQASYNPYKRQPRAPSKEYLANPLVDNPLGLIDANPVSVEEYYRKGHTPWIWQTRPLEPDSDESTSGQQQKRNATDPYPNNPSTPSGPSRRLSESDAGSEPESFTAKIELQPTFSSKIIRTPDHYRNRSLSGTPTSSPRNSRGGSIESLSSRLGQISISSNASSSPSSSLSRHSSMPNTSTSSFSSVYSASPSKPDYASGPMLTDRLSDEPESMLSPLIIAKTPGPAPQRTLRNHPNPLLSTQSLDTIPEAPPANGDANYRNGGGNSSSSSTAAQQQQRPQQTSTLAPSAYPRPAVQHAHTMPAPKSQVVYTATAPPPPLLPPPRMPTYSSSASNDHNSNSTTASAGATTRDRERSREREQEAERAREAERKREREKKWEQEREQDRIQRAREREKEVEMQRQQQREDWERERYREKERAGSKHTTYVDPHLNSQQQYGTPSPRSSSSGSGSGSGSQSSSGSSNSSAHPSPVRRSSSYNHTPPSNPTYSTSSPSGHHNNTSQQAHSYSSYPYSQPHHSSSLSQSTTAPATHSSSTATATASSHPTTTSTSASTTTPSTTITSPATSTTNANSKLANPLPAPPQLVQRPPILPVQRTPPPKWRERVRYGFWNRRGDHLTPDGYIVYAPVERAYPQDLQNHPKEQDGYENHERLFTAYVQRPELPQSLPKHGQPPECPYEAFIVYHYK